MKKALLSLVVALGMLTAQPLTARIDVDASSSKTVLTNHRALVSNASVRPATWGTPEYRSQYVNAEFTLKPNAWNELAWQFTPLRDGKATLNVMGPWYKPQGASNIMPVWIFIDELSATGTSLNNTGFEELDAKGLPKGWSIQRDAKVCSNTKYVKAGQYSVMTAHDHRFSQLIILKSNQAITLRAWAYIEPVKK